jgi:hypothetical protein
MVVFGWSYSGGMVEGRWEEVERFRVDWFREVLRSGRLPRFLASTEGYLKISQ